MKIYNSWADIPAKDPAAIFIQTDGKLVALSVDEYAVGYAAEQIKIMCESQTLTLT